MKIEGKKVILRNWRKSDAKELAKLVQDRQISKFTRVPFPHKLKDSKQFIRECKKNGRKGTEICFAVIDRQSKKIAGSLGIMGINRQCNKAEIGYLLGKEIGRAHV